MAFEFEVIGPTPEFEEAVKKHIAKRFMEEEEKAEQEYWEDENKLVEETNTG